jgi:DNA polymerase-3 subunit gamma/tau
MSAEKSEKQEEYRVLARKYRPQNFDDLIGQDALVRTLKNAIESGRIAHAFMLTGIRGVGKTTTARIIAKALNYTGADGAAGPTTGDTSDCSICQAKTAILMSWKWTLQAVRVLMIFVRY